MIEASKKTLITSNGNRYPYFPALIKAKPTWLMSGSVPQTTAGAKRSENISQPHTVRPTKADSNAGTTFLSSGFSVFSPTPLVSRIENTYNTMMPPA